MVKFDFNLKPLEAIEYLKNKGYKLSFDYTDMQKQAHHKAFTIAKITQLDLLTDVHQELVKSSENGTSFKEFKKSIVPTLQKKGWWGKKEVVNPKTGEIKEINIGNSRLRTIYNTNIRMAYNVAREQQMDELPLSIYRRYVSALLENTRASHRAMHGIIKHKDDEFWIYNSPMNDYDCNCKKQAVSLREIKKRGWKVNNEKLENIASKDFTYDIRQHRYKTDNIYFEKVQALRCNKKAFAKVKKVLCPYEEIVKETYKEDMLKLRPKKGEWIKFVDDSLNTDIKHHSSVYLGFLTMIEGLELYLEKNPPKSDLILADTGTIRNLRAKGSDVSKSKNPKKIKNTLEIEEIKELYTRIHEPDEIWEDGDILLVYDITKGKNKIVIKIDHETKKNIYNNICSGQKYTEEGFKRNTKKAKRIFKRSNK